MARPRSKAVLLSAVSLAALAGVGAFGAKVTTERSLTAAATRAGASIGGVEANPIDGRIVLRDLHLAGTNATVTIGRVSTTGGPALITPALAAEDVTLENVTLIFGPFRYIIPRMTVVGSNLDRAGIEALFAANASDTLANRLTKLSASSLTIPELKFEQNLTFGEVTTRSTGNYVNLVARDIINGRAAILIADGGSYSTTVRTEAPKPTPGAAPQGNSGSDAPAKAATQDGTTTGTYGAFSVADIDFAFLTRLYTEGAGTGANPPVQVYGPFKMVDMAMTEANGTKINIAEIFGDGFVARLGKKPLLSLVETLQKLPMDDANKDKSSFQIIGEAMAMFESIVSGAMTARAITVEVTDPDPFKFNVGDFTVGLGTNPTPQKANAAYPTQGGMRFAVNDIALAIPPDADNDFAKRLTAMGYKDLSLSFAIEGKLNEAGKELVINEFSFGGKDMGRATISGVVGNVTPELLSSEEAVRNAAGMALTVKNLAVTVDNAGLADKLLAEEAAKQNKSPDALKTEYGMIATVGVPSFLGGSAESKALGAAVARFIAKPGQIAVKAAAKDPAGFGLADYGATGGQPAAILEQIDLSAEAK
ncbi:MAG: hypothetical protein KF735_09295 [Chelatococcus sp.]|uniref:hypothetical protein n=1 Tax=Chelatococcus sp. TaxID=1953771 RepID=UPI0025C40977|nr:hypothetical protein [Chelatococcus sp.]MBX3537821.1 hypothetical protein [Chelatococcus sp.]